jgi:hypothetical protein
MGRIAARNKEDAGRMACHISPPLYNGREINTREKEQNDRT